MLNDASSQPLSARGFEREGEAWVWTGKHGTSIRVESSGDDVRVAVCFDDEQVLGYEIRVAPAHLSELTAALAGATDDLDHLRHGGFSTAVARLATSAVVQTTKGYKIRPRLDDGELVWEPIDG